MKFSLMFFASNEESLHNQDIYRLVFDSARFGDAHDFANVWVPERHFTALGSLFPNPAVLHAALARETTRIGLCAGSVVAPLHHPMRIAEEWAVVDNLSRGRVGISLAAGWNPNDFAFFPQRYDDRNAHLTATVPVLRALWRGDPVEQISGTGSPVALRTYPRPIQPELPLWLTAASAPPSFVRAGHAGTNLLTHLLDQGVETLAERIADYRGARAEAGHNPATGQVTVMLHTFVGPDRGHATDTARDPYCAYLKNNIGLLRGLGASRGHDIDPASLSAEELDEFVGVLYDRFAASRSLIGSPESCLPLVRRLAEIGVDEIACLLDFGPSVDEVLAGLPELNQLRESAFEELGGDQLTNAVPTLGDTEAVSEPPRPAPTRWAEDPAEVINRCGAPLDVGAFFDRLAVAGAEYGPSMRCLEAMWVGEDEVLGELRVPTGAEADSYVLHPGLLDNAFLLLGALTPGALEGSGVLALPSGVDELSILRPLTGHVFSHVVRNRAAEQRNELVADVRLFTRDGLFAEARDLRMRVVESVDAEPVGADLCYRTEWIPLAEAGGGYADPAVPQRQWLVVDDGSDTGKQVEAALDHHAMAVQRFTGMASDAEAFVRDHLSATDPLGILVVCPEADPASGTEAMVPVMDLIRAIVRDPGADRRIWLVTRGAQPAGAQPISRTGLVQAQAWGLGRVLAVEHPGLWGGLIDLDPSGVAGADQLGRILGEPGTEDQFAVRGTEILVPRLVRDATTAPLAPTVADPATTYLLTGGLGDLGLAIAGRLVDRGARSLVLTGRSGIGTEQQRAIIADLVERGAEVLTVSADVTEYDAVQSIPEALAEAGLPPVGGVVHLAGVADGAMLRDMTAERWCAVAAAKVTGTWNLHRAFPDAHTFLLVSALPATLGPIGAGAANYAAANAFVDAFAHYRRGLALPGCALGYGPWREIGMAVRQDGLDLLAGFGVGSMAPGEALDIFDAVLATQPPQLTIARIDWPTLFSMSETAGRTGQFAQLLAASGEAAMGGETVAEFAAADPDQRAAVVDRYVRQRLSTTLQTEADDLDFHQPMVQLGLDSLMFLELRNRIRADIGISIPMVRFLDGPSAAELSEVVREILTGLTEEREEFAL